MTGAIRRHPANLLLKNRACATLDEVQIYLQFSTVKDRLFLFSCAKVRNTCEPYVRNIAFFNQYSNMHPGRLRKHHISHRR